MSIRCALGCVGLLAVLLAQAEPVSFTKYVKLWRGMTEAEVIDIAGPPDLVTEGPQVLLRTAPGVRVLSRNYTYIWRSNAAIPYTTSVVFTDGVVQVVRRDRKF